MKRLRNELLNKEIFDKLKGVNVVIERWQKENKQQRLKALWDEDH
jgi:hypothetical protein